MTSPNRRGLVAVALAAALLAACSTSDDTAPEPAARAEPLPPRSVVLPALDMPTPDDVGAPDGVDFDVLDPEDIESGGHYTEVRVPGDIELGEGETIRFEDCLIEGSIVTSTPLELVRCDVIGGLYPTDVGGLLREVLIDSPNGQAFRPAVREMGGFARSTPWTVEDTYLRIEPGGEGGHVEAVQILGGRDFVFRNVVFDTGCPFNGTQTADLSMNAADSLVEDSWFIGCGGYAIYSDGPGVRIVRPRIGDRHRWGILYRDPEADRIDPVIVDPMDLDGDPIDL